MAQYECILGSIDNNTKERGAMMKYPPVVVLIAVLVLLFILLHFIPWQMLLFMAFIAFVVFVFVGYLYQAEKEERVKDIPQYQPSQTTPPASPPLQSAPQTQPPSPATLVEQPKMPSYEQGYQAQSSPDSLNWSPFSGLSKSNKQEQDAPAEYEQPQAQYPEQMPPKA